MELKPSQLLHDSFFMTQYMTKGEIEAARDTVSGAYDADLNTHMLTEEQLEFSAAISGDFHKR